MKEVLILISGGRHYLFGYLIWIQHPALTESAEHEIKNVLIKSIGVTCFSLCNMISALHDYIVLLVIVTLDWKETSSYLLINVLGLNTTTSLFFTTSSKSEHSKDIWDEPPYELNNGKQFPETWARTFENRSIIMFVEDNWISKEKLLSGLLEPVCSSH